MVRYQQDAPGRDVVDAVHFAPKVLPVEHRHGQKGVLRPLGIEAEGVDAGRPERKGHPRESLVEALAEQSRERIVDGLFRRPEETTHDPGRAVCSDVDARQRAGSRRGVGSHGGAIMDGVRDGSTALCSRGDRFPSAARARGCGRGRRAVQSVTAGRVLARTRLVAGALLLACRRQRFGSPRLLGRRRCAAHGRDATRPPGR